MGVRVLVGVVAAALVAVAAAEGGAAAGRAPEAFRCPAPVPIVGDVRRTQVDELFFAVMRRAEEAGRMPEQADVDAALTADPALIAQEQSDTYTPTNVLLYTLHPGGAPGFRAGFFTTQTWGYTIEQRTPDQAPTVTDSEATFRRTGGDLTEVRRVMSLIRGYRDAAGGGMLPFTSRLVADALHRGINEGRVTTIAETAVPRTGWIGIRTGTDHDHVVVRGRTCSKVITMHDDVGGHPTRPLPACPPDVRVATADQRQARRVFDTAMEAALLAGRASPDASDVTAALGTVGVAATDVTDMPQADLPADGLVYELGADRFAVARRVTGGGEYRIEWFGIDLPIVVTDANDTRGDAIAGFRWRLDRIAAAIHPYRGRFRPARDLARLHVPGVTIRVVALRDRRDDPGRRRAGIWVSADRRVALVRGGICGPVYGTYAST